MDFLHQEYKEFLVLLNKYKVKYMLIGGVAVNIYGYKRMTEDLDILFEATSANGKKLLLAIGDLGYDTSSFKDTDFITSINFRLGEAPNTIDVKNETIGINYELAFKRTKELLLENIAIPVIHINDLIENKKALNTYKDLADAEVLDKIRNNNV